MAGIGVKLNRIYQKNTITTNIVGFFYSMTMTIAPVLVVIINLMLMQKVLKFNTVRYIDRELFSCTVLYVFMRYYPDICQMQSLKNGMKMCFHAIESVC